MVFPKDLNRLSQLTSTPRCGIMGASIAVLPHYRGQMDGLEGKYGGIYSQDLVGR